MLTYESSYQLPKEPKPFKGFQLQTISLKKLLSELEAPDTGLIRKNAIINAFAYVKKITDSTRGQYPNVYGFANPGGSVPYWFLENAETGLIHVHTDFVAMCYNPGYIFEH